LNRKSFLLIVSFIFLASLFSGVSNASDVNRIINARLSDSEIKKTIFGIIAFLDDTQVRNRPGTQSSVYDASDVGDGCDGKIEFNLPGIHKALSLPALPPIKVRNVDGEWASTVHFLPRKFGREGKSLVAVPDSNLFVPAFVAYPLYLFREESPDGRFILRMLKCAWLIDTKYKRGDAYNFWMPLRENPICVGPFNIPVDKAILPLAKAFVNPKLAFFWNKLAKGLNVPPPDWVVRCLDAKQNPTGAAALFNIPNDSDDSSTALSIQKIRTQLQGAYADDKFVNDAGNFAIDMPVLDVIFRYRDTGRKPEFEDGRDAWKGRDTGAFLTWFQDETAPTFGDPGRGVIPLGKNNVDSVVNSNVLLTLGLLGKKGAPGYREACAVVEKAIVLEKWPQCGLYYPQYMIFPYTASRAYRDGGVAELEPAMRVLLKQVLAAQRSYAGTSGRAGAFPGGEDRTDFLSTALGVTTLLNIGADIAEKEGLGADYKSAIEGGISYLQSKRVKYKLKNPDTIGRDAAGRDIYGIYWDSGLFFSASFWDLGHWRSVAFCNAMVLEAFAKYVLAYDQSGVNIINGRRLRIKNYPPSMNDMEKFILEVK